MASPTFLQRTAIFAMVGLALLLSVLPPCSGLSVLSVKREADLTQSIVREVLELDLKLAGEDRFLLAVPGANASAVAKLAAKAAEKHLEVAKLPKPPAGFEPHTDVQFYEVTLPPAGA
eukprot:RCo005919